MRRRRILLALMAGLPAILMPPALRASDDADDDLAETWGPFRGRIVDADTGQPVPGAVFVAIWLESVPALIRVRKQFYDARAAVAGPDGAFGMPRRPPPFFRSAISTDFGYLAPGHVAVTHPVTIEGLARLAVRKFAALTPDAKRVHQILKGPFSWIPGDREAALIDTINIERRRMGLGPIRRLRGGPQ
jgi:hypothetical protein